MPTLQRLVTLHLFVPAGVASEAALSAAGVLANVTADATEIAQQAWNITNQLSWLGAEVRQTCLLCRHAGSVT